MVESKLVELVVAGSNPVGHPTFFSPFSIKGVPGAAKDVPDLVIWNWALAEISALSPL